MGREERLERREALVRCLYGVSSVFSSPARVSSPQVVVGMVYI